MSESWHPVVHIHPAQWTPSANDPPLVSVAAQSVALTWSWGVEPGEASVTYVVADGSDVDVAPYQEVALELFGRRFFGVATAGSRMTGSGGRTREFTFHDHRLFLDSDAVFGVWNQSQSRMVSGHWQRRWWHIRPQDFTANRRTWTMRPLTIAEILEDVFQAPTVGIAWSRSYHASMSTTVGPSLDSGSGRKLGELLATLSEAAGLSFTADGWYQLVWGRLGALDPVIPDNSDNQRSGSSVTKSPTKVHVVGGRNLYQVLNLDLEVDWNRQWDRYWMPDGEAYALVSLVYWNAKPPGKSVTYAELPLPSGETDRWFAWHAASARALQITVREVAALVPEFDLRDQKLYAGRSRMDMPAILYLRALVYRAYRLPATLMGRPRSSFTIANDGPAQLDYDPATGNATPRFEASSGAGAGLVLVRNHNFDSQYLSMVRPETLSLDRLAEAGSLWAPVGFSTDDNGEDDGQVIFLERPSVALHEAITMVDGLAVFRASRDPLSASPVRASLSLLGERFATTFGSGARSTVVNESALRREAVFDPATGAQHEVPYADGSSAMAVARRLAQPAMDGYVTMRQGSFVAKVQPGETLAPLNVAYSRVTARYGSDGHTVSFEMAAHPPRRTYVPEPELDRAYRMQSGLPGLEELRQERRALQVQEVVLRQRPELARELRRAYSEMVGDRGPVEHAIVAAGSGALAAGTPLWKAPGAVSGSSPMSNRTTVMPASSSDTHEEFVGVTVRDSEAADGIVPVQSSGLLLARVAGPVSPMQQVGRSNGNAHLQAASEGALAVGVALQSVAVGQTRLIRIRTQGNGGGQGSDTWA